VNQVASPAAPGARATPGRDARRVPQLS